MAALEVEALMISYAENADPLQTNKLRFFNTCHSAKQEYSFTVKYP